MEAHPNWPTSWTYRRQNGSMLKSSKMKTSGNQSSKFLNLAKTTAVLFTRIEFTLWVAPRRLIKLSQDKENKWKC